MRRMLPTLSQVCETGLTPYVDCSFPSNLNSYKYTLSPLGATTIEHLRGRGTDGRPALGPGKLPPGVGGGSVG